MATARCIRVRVESESITLRDLGSYVGQDVTIFVVGPEEVGADSAPPDEDRLGLPFGVDRGRIAVAPDFDELPRASGRLRGTRDMSS